MSVPDVLSEQELAEIGLIAIIRANFSADMVPAGRALADGGLRAVEITLNTPGAFDTITALRNVGITGLRVGAGTILSTEDARLAHAAGAEFIVTPTLQIETINYCNRQQLPILCGCMTPTEALSAHQAGANFIKLFPAHILGPSYVSAILAPLPFLKIFPTGGVTPSNLADYIRVGSVGVAIGSNLVSQHRLLTQDWTGIADSAAEYVQSLAAARAAQRG